MPTTENPSEELFARLCSSKYLAGFVYRSPKYRQPTEQEAGDIVLWVNGWLIIFEVIWRNPDAGPDLKNFIRRIGTKRDQVLGDFDVYGNPNIVITMTNEAGETAEYDHSHFNQNATRGVVIVDAPGSIGPLRQETLRLTIEAPYPITVMTRKDFEDVLVEADTIGDIGVYLGDRHGFLGEVFLENPDPFLRLGESLERELIGLYKLNDNRFDVEAWRRSEDKRFWDSYRTERREAIGRRDAENSESQMLDDLLAAIQSSNRAGSNTLYHTWELALTQRRERVNINERIQKKYDALMSTGKDQQFAVKNFHSGCWDVFYLHLGLDTEFFRAEAQLMAERKMWIERALNNFQYTVLCFALRYSPVGDGSITEVFLPGVHASQCPTVTPEQLEEARKYFASQTESKPVVEFPEE